MEQDREYRVALCGRNLQDLREILKRYPFRIVTDAPDVVISYGGDGSLLGAERQFPGIPKCPIRDRRMNPKCSAHGEENILRGLAEGTLSRTSLSKVIAETEDGRSLSGMNDIVLSKSVISSAVRYRIWLDGELYRSQGVGDGLVVATAFGSTGYYQSITRGSFQVGTGLAFNNATDWQDHVVVRTETIIDVQLLRGPAVLLADNDPVRVDLGDGERVRFSRSDHTTLIYGLETFRCRECYRLREDGKHL